MPREQLTTNQTVDNLPPPAAAQSTVYYWCTDKSGFGVAVGKSKKTFIVQREVDGKTVRTRIGTRDEMNVAKARRLADVELGQLSSGINVNRQRRLERANGMTLKDAWDTYKEYLTANDRSPSTISDYEHKLNCYVPDWLDKPLVDIKSKARERHAKLGKERGKYAANGTLRIVRAIWRYTSEDFEEIGNLPRIRYFEEHRRSAVIEPDQFADWWIDVHALACPRRRDMYLFLLFTGTRSEETRSLRWDQVDLENGTVEFRKTKTKPFTLPLSEFLLELLKRRRACNDTTATFGEDCPWVFPAHTKAGYIAEARLSPHERGEVKVRNTEQFEFKVKFFPHMLRHTFITIAENRVAIPSMHGRLLTNHAIPKNDVHGGYNHPHIQDLRASQELISQWLLSACRASGDNGNVIPLAKRESA